MQQVGLDPSLTYLDFLLVSSAEALHAFYQCVARFCLSSESKADLRPLIQV